MNMRLADVRIPLLDYAVGAACVLGIRDSGKTVICKGLAEQLIEVKIPVVVFDAVGKWRFMKVAAKGGRGYKVVVVGGREPDLPLSRHSIAEVIRAALKERIPIIVDLFDPKLSKQDWKHIVKTAIKIIHYENDGSPIHVFLEEAAEFVPQRIIDADVYAEIEKLARMGGNNGVGITLINQRSQEVNKAVLEQCTTLILGNQIGNKAIEAVSKWVERLDEGTCDDVLKSLPTLKPGQAYVWTRQNQDKPSCQQFPMCKSFHPDRRTQTAHIKDVGAVSDTTEFISKMSEAIPKVIEDAKANDPEELKKEIRKLQGEIRKAAATPEVKETKVPVFDENQQQILKDISNALMRCDKLMEETKEAMNQLTDWAISIQPRPELFRPRGIIVQHGNQKPFLLNERHTTHISKHQARKQRETAGKLNKAERTILNVVGTYPGADRKKIAILAGYARKGGSFVNAIGSLRTAGLMTGGVDGQEECYLTDLGKEILGPVEAPPTGEQLFQQWMSKLNSCESEILRVMWEQQRPMTADEIAELTISKQTGGPYEPKGGSFVNSLGALRTRGVVEGYGTIKLAEAFNT